MNLIFMDTFFLYINPLGATIRFLIFDQIHLIKAYDLDKIDTSSTFPKHLVEVVEQYNIHEIWCILWPWAFTLMRTVTLSINTVWITRQIQLKWCHIFDILKNKERNPLIQINPSEYLCHIDGSEKIFSSETLPPGKYIWFSSGKDFTDTKTFVEYEENPDEIRAFFEKKKTENRLSPIYFKPPHITWSKKKVSHF